MKTPIGEAVDLVRALTVLCLTVLIIVLLAEAGVINMQPIWTLLQKVAS